MNVGIIGLGLIGGSFAKALKTSPTHVFATDLDAETLKMALADSVEAELTDDKIPECDLIILATFPKGCVEWFKNHANQIKKDAIVIDIAGTKTEVCKDCWKIAEDAGLTFVGTHPMAGTQFSGYGNARANMFEGAPMILCPNPSLSDMERVIVCDKIQTALRPCKFGFYTLSTPEHHDEVIAYTSQLAHVVSSAYANNPLALEHDGFSAGSWKDLTRVAWMNPKMWSELFLENSENLSAVIGKTIENLERCKRAIDSKDKLAIEEFLSEGDAIKRQSEAKEKEK